MEGTTIMEFVIYGISLLVIIITFKLLISTLLEQDHKRDSSKGNSESTEICEIYEKFMNKDGSCNGTWYGDMGADFLSQECTDCPRYIKNFKEDDKIGRMG